MLLKPDSLATRVATVSDLPFIDALQKAHHKQLGFFPRAQMEEYLRAQWVLVAEDAGQPIGYVASRDRYLKRDELGAIFQMCVAPGNQRKLVAATLLQAVFDRAPYGCRLFCCWCAQDIEANHFWEAMGFIPLAFRAGSEKKSRVHIFWQKRIRADDDSTPYWFPSQTTGGAIGAGRIVLPIPPGTHWSDAKPLILPNAEPKPRALPTPRKPVAPTKRRVRFGPPGASLPAAPVPPAPPEPKTKIAQPKNDPKLIAAARELRDRWLEQVNAGEHLPQIEAKYDVRRLPAPASTQTIEANPIPLLEAA